MTFQCGVLYTTTHSRKVVFIIVNYEEIEMTQKQKLFNALSKGIELTSKQIRSRLGIASPSKVVHRLREDGVKIATQETVSKKGVVTYKYALSQRTKRAAMSAA